MRGKPLIAPYGPIRNFMQPHQQRVVDEKTELDEKITKLRAFFDNPIYKSLLIDEQERLDRQLQYMLDYSEVLGERIAAFTE